MLGFQDWVFSPRSEVSERRGHDPKGLFGFRQALLALSLTQSLTRIKSWVGTTLSRKGEGDRVCRNAPQFFRD